MSLDTKPLKISPDKKIRYRTELLVLKAFHGDSILLKTYDNEFKEFIILIDGGPAQTFTYSLKSELQSLTKIDLIILTHIDSDHISGLIKFFKSSLIKNIDIKEIWMNHPELIEVNNSELISTKQGDKLKELIQTSLPEVNLKEFSTVLSKFTISGIEFLPLSPTPDVVQNLYDHWKSLAAQTENKIVNISLNQDINKIPLQKLSTDFFRPDKSVKNDIYNASSIAFLMMCPDMSILFLADSRSEIIVDSLRGYGFNESNPLKVDYVKVSHHGSKNNTSAELLNLIDCDNFIISTNGGNSSNTHPSRETIARIVYNTNRTDDQLTIYFNYKIEELQKRIGPFIGEEDIQMGNWKPVYKNTFYPVCTAK